MSTGRRDGRPRLVADVGGTNVRFALVPAGGDEPTAVRTLQTSDYPDFAAAARDYLEAVGSPRPSEGLGAVAAAVLGDGLKLTNNEWSFSIEETREHLGLERLRFVNDWAAQALAVPHLPAESVRRIGRGTPRPGYAIAVLGPGTGLGVSGLVPAGNGWEAIEGEGGHATFSPATDREAAVAAVIRRRFGHCSAERVVSGIGLVSTYEALCELDGQEAEPLEARTVVARARQGGYPHCREAVEMFYLGLATTAANLAATLGALGGVYVGGGILPRLGDLFDPAAFRERFEDKGRFREYLADIPTYLMTAENPALLGLAKKLGPVHE